MLNTQASLTPKFVGRKPISSDRRKAGRGHPEGAAKSLLFDLIFDTVLTTITLQLNLSAIFGGRERGGMAGRIAAVAGPLKRGDRNAKPRWSIRHVLSDSIRRMHQ